MQIPHTWSLLLKPWLNVSATQAVNPEEGSLAGPDVNSEVDAQVDAEVSSGFNLEVNSDEDPWADMMCNWTDDVPWVGPHTNLLNTTSHSAVLVSKQISV